MRAYGAVNSFIFKHMKYMFYIIFAVMAPLVFKRFCFDKGESLLEPSSLHLQLAWFLFLFAMAFWSHWNASPPTDPGYLKWEDFRSEEQLKDIEDK